MNKQPPFIIIDPLSPAEIQDILTCLIIGREILTARALSAPTAKMLEHVERRLGAQSVADNTYRFSGIALRGLMETVMSEQGLSYKDLQTQLGDLTSDDLEEFRQAADELMSQWGMDRDEEDELPF
jgi:hypothetical protein